MSATSTQTGRPPADQPPWPADNWSSTLNVLHIVGSDTPSTRLLTLRSLLCRAELGRQRVACFGRAAPDVSDLADVARLSAPFGLGWLARRSLRSVVPPVGPTILHVWSADSLSWVVPALAGELRSGSQTPAAPYGLLFEAELPGNFRRLVAQFARPRGNIGRHGATRLRFVCPSETVRQRLLEAGVSANDCALIRTGVDFAALNAADRTGLRGQLSVSERDTALLVLPPVTRQTGAFVAAWAAMLLEKVRRGTRLIVPEHGPEVRRICRLVSSCRHEWMLRLAGRRFTLAELLVAADLVVYLPAGDAPLDGVAWALAAGRTIVASAVRATTELLRHRQNAWLCRPQSPRDAARRLLEALEEVDQSRRHAAIGRAQAFELFSRQRMVEQYARTYADLIGDRPLVG